MQGGAQQLVGRNQEMLAEGTWTVMPLGGGRLNSSLILLPRRGRERCNFPSPYLMISSKALHATSSGKPSMIPLSPGCEQLLTPLPF